MELNGGRLEISEEIEMKKATAFHVSIQLNFYSYIGIVKIQTMAKHVENIIKHGYLIMVI